MFLPRKLILFSPTVPPARPRYPLVDIPMNTSSDSTRPYVKWDPSTHVFAVLVLEAAAEMVWEKNTADWLVAGGCCWSSVRGKHCWLVLEQNKRTGDYLQLHISLANPPCLSFLLLQNRTMWGRICSCEAASAHQSISESYCFGTTSGFLWRWLGAERLRKILSK